MFDNIPQTALEALDWQWDDYQPYFDDLMQRDLSEATIKSWLKDWSSLTKLFYECYSRLHVNMTLDTGDEAARDRFFAFLENIVETAEEANHALQLKLLKSEIEPEGIEIPLRDIRGDVALFREANIPLQTQADKLGNEYDSISGDQAAEWDGEERTYYGMLPYFYDNDRSIREGAWRAIYDRRLEDREALNDIWVKLLTLRQEIAKNADLPDYRTYRWQSSHRFDYTPEDNQRFLDSIELVVVPAANRLIDRRKRMLDLETLRPWDMNVDPSGQTPLKPFGSAEDLINGAERIFSQVDPELGEYFATMKREALLDLDNRKGKAPGGYCTTFAVAGRPFIFMNAVGIHDDVQTLLHEAGHAFHAFESSKLQYHVQQHYPTEFAEVASMSMELLAGPYLTTEHGGFYTEVDAARARIEHLEGGITFWPYMAVVDAFQHWVYENVDDALQPANCDAKWGELWDRFMPGVDWTELEDIKVTGWQRKLHIFQIPFYYLEYGLAQLGAFQVWQNSLSDPAGALAQYRHGLSLGNTVNLPELFSATGAKLAFDPDTLGESVALAENTIMELDQNLA